jgi:hypothetical protein
MLERTPSGNEVVTTMLPMYADGTDEFVVLEARHWIAKKRSDCCRTGFIRTGKIWE